MMDIQAFFHQITEPARSLAASQTSVASLLEMLPAIISVVDPLSSSSDVSDDDRLILATKLTAMLEIMTERRLDVTLEEWNLEAHGDKKAKRIVNFKRTNESPDGLHSVFVLPVYAGPGGKPYTVVQHQLRPHAGVVAHLEIPAGKFDRGDMSTEATAARELQEETGLVWHHGRDAPIARGGRHDRDGGLSNALGEVLVVPVDISEDGFRSLSNDEKAQGLGQIHDFPVELVPEYVDYCLAQGLSVTGTISTIALGMKVQRFISSGVGTGGTSQGFASKHNVD